MRARLLDRRRAGFVPFDRAGGELLFNLFAERYERVPITVAAEPIEWREVMKLVHTSGSINLGYAFQIDDHDRDLLSLSESSSNSSPTLFMDGLERRLTSLAYFAQAA